MSTRFPKVFVFSNVGSKWVVNTGAKPPALTAGQGGPFIVDQYGVNTGGTGATPDPAVIRVIRFAQNVGDTSFGTVQSKPIFLEKVIGYNGKKATAAATQITYIGYDESDNTKDITANCGKELLIPIMIWEKKLARYYAPTQFRKTLIIDTGCCPDCGSPCTAADKAAIAAMIVDQVNNGLQRTGDYEAGNELGQYLTATAVDNGQAGDDLRVGVKLVTKAVDNDAQQALDSCDPIKFWEFQTYYFTVGSVYNGYCDSSSLPVTTTQNADPGSGWAAGVAAYEAESQGYDRVRNPVTSYPFSKLNNYKIYAVAGTKYDAFHVRYNWSHQTPSGAAPDQISEPYEVILFCPTTTGDVIETMLNTWLAGRFTALNLN
jgi:hypothetical protein